MTPKQEAFCQFYVELGNASEAYRRAYNAAKMKPATVNVKASELLAAGKIAVRVKELKAEHAERHKVTVDDIARMLLEDREFARAEAKPSACVAASMGLAKLYGYLTEKHEHAGANGKDLIPARSDEETLNMLADRIREVLRRHPSAQASHRTVQ